MLKSASWKPWYAAVLISIVYALSGAWDYIIGYSSAFASAAQADDAYSITRYSFHFGKIAMCALLVVRPSFFEKRQGPLLTAAPFTMCVATILFGLAYHQTLVNPPVLGIAGSAIMGFSFVCFDALLCVFLAKTYDMKKAILIIAISQCMKQLFPLIINHAIPEAALVLICPALPIICLLCFSAASKLAKPLPIEKPLMGSAKSHQLLLFVLSYFALVVMSAVSTVGIWGEPRVDYTAANSVPVLFKTLATCAIALLLTHATLVKSIDEPLGFRYQIPFLILVAGFMFAVLQPVLSYGAPLFYSVSLSTSELFAHILAWTIMISSVKCLGFSPFRTAGIGLGIHSLCSAAWILILGTASVETDAILIVASFFLIIAIAVHPRLIYKKNLPFMGTTKDLNEYTIGGEPEIPVESNGTALTHLLENRCSYLAQRNKLSKREEQVMVLLAKGRTRPFIQEALVLSEGTAKTHISHVYKKLAVTSHQELLDLVFEAPSTEPSDSIL